MTVWLTYLAKAMQRGSCLYKAASTTTFVLLPRPAPRFPFASLAERDWGGGGRRGTESFGQLVRLGFGVTAFTPASYQRPRLGRPS